MPLYLDADMTWNRFGHTIERRNDSASKLLRLENELAQKTQFADRLQILLRARAARIDQLNATIDWLRQQNKALDEEADRLAELVKLAP
jgi:hypothetical protein